MLPFHQTADHSGPGDARGYAERFGSLAKFLFHPTWSGPAITRCQSKIFANTWAKASINRSQRLFRMDAAQEKRNFLAPKFRIAFEEFANFMLWVTCRSGSAVVDDNLFAAIQPE